MSIVPRKPLKDLKIPFVGLQTEEDDHMSECETTDIGSPMSIEKSVHKSPKVRETNKDTCELYNCDEYEREIFKYLREAEVIIFTIFNLQGFKYIILIIHRGICVHLYITY